MILENKNASSTLKFERHNLPFLAQWLLGNQTSLANDPRVRRLLRLEPWSGAVLDGPPRLFCFLDPELAPGYIAWIAHDGDETHLGVGGYPALFDPAAALETFRSRVAGLVDLQHAKQIERRAGYIPVGGVLPNIANTNGLLIGDAAGALSPLTAGRVGSMYAPVGVRSAGRRRLFVEW